jgi:hypothetical chaperone protein
MLGVGIDYGTSNSSAAVFDGERLHMIEVDAAAVSPEVMPSALYLDRKLAGTVGQAAIDRYIRENAGRRVTLEREQVGTIDIHVATTDQSQYLGGDGISFEAQVHAFTDQGLPGRLFRGVKRWLATENFDRLRVFEGRYRLVALVTPVLAHLAETARASGARTYVGRPVHYESGGAGVDDVAARRMREACGHAGLRDFALHPEPIGAALSFLHRNPDASPRLVLAFDFGGGTLDFALIRARERAFEILATHGIGFGGDEINRTIYRAKVFPELGDGLFQHIPVDDHLQRVRFPFDIFADRLLNWSLAFELNRPELCELMGQAMRESADARRKLTRLYELVTRNQAYLVVQAIERAKVELSSRAATTIEVEDLDLDVPLSRSELETLLEPGLARIERCIDELLERAGITAEAVDVVVRTGGSSHIPIVIERLDARFPGRVVAHDAFTSIAAGLAIAAFRGDKAA